MNRRRVVVTGLGTVNPLALNVPDYWRGLLAGRSGIAPIKQFDTTAFKVHFGGEVKDWQPEKYIEPRLCRRLDRYAQFAFASTGQALKDSGIDLTKYDPSRCGVIIGSGIGGLNELEEQHTRYAVVVTACVLPLAYAFFKHAEATMADVI